MPLTLDAPPLLPATPDRLTWPATVAGGVSATPTTGRGRRYVECGDDPDDDDEDLGEEEELPMGQPAPEDESSFDDFDDDFDDDFEEDENDPDWDHPDDAVPEPPPPGKGGGRKK